LSELSLRRDTGAGGDALDDSWLLIHQVRETGKCCGVVLSGRFDPGVELFQVDHDRHEHVRIWFKTPAPQSFVNEGGSGSTTAGR
jgi:hypothetical protein